MMLRAACLQLNSQADIPHSLAAITPLLNDAKANGAQLVALPENAPFLGGDDAQKLASARPEETHPALPFFAEAAQRLGLWIAVGSMTIMRPDGKFNNRAFLFAPNGAIVARYDKIHLFDASLANGEVYRESKLTAGGDRAVIADTPFGKLGMTICYDLRFAALYRALAKAGARIITTPAAFVAANGTHWPLLVRTRAVETGCFVLAAAQCGTHTGGRQTFGHSLIVDPWGNILAEAGDTPTVIYADLDLDEVTRVRERLPSLRHDRDFMVS